MLQTTSDRMAPARRLNLAIGLFDQALSTELALHEFRLRNMELARCRFVVSRESPTFGEEALAQFSTQVSIERITLGGLTVEQAWSEIVIPREAAPLPSAQDRAVSDMTASVLARQNRRLIQHLETGGGVLVVGLDDQAEQQVVAGLLLRLARGVLTHQVRASGMGGLPHKSINRPRASAQLL